jgi:hypothetical protein
VAKLQNPTRSISAPPDKIKFFSFTHWFGFFSDWAMLFHMIVTAVLIALFYNVS